jgi:hypothetical protein
MELPLKRITITEGSSGKNGLMHNPNYFVTIQSGNMWRDGPKTLTNMELSREGRSSGKN